MHMPSIKSIAITAAIAIAALIVAKRLPYIRNYV
jgi:hypothetical protein